MKHINKINAVGFVVLFLILCVAWRWGVIGLPLKVGQVWQKDSFSPFDPLQVHTVIAVKRGTWGIQWVQCTNECGMVREVPARCIAVTHKRIK